MTKHKRGSPPPPYTVYSTSPNTIYYAYRVWRLFSSAAVALASPRHVNCRSWSAKRGRARARKGDIGTVRPSQIGSYTWSYLVQLITLAAQVDKEAGAGQLLDDFMVEPLGQRRESSTPPSVAPLLTLCLLNKGLPCAPTAEQPAPPHNPHRYAR